VKVTNAAALNVFVGASGSGKSHAIKQALTDARPARLLVCDPDAEYGKFAKPAATLGEVVTLATAQDFAITFTPSDDRALGIKQFAFLCALAWVIANDKGRPLTFVVDELAEYVTASEAPPSWRRLVKRGRKYGVTVFAGSQRPAEIDKTIWSNASLIRAGRLANQPDQLTVARALDIDAKAIGALTGHAWISLDRNTGKRRQGV
jgi:hypothetical protein